MKKILTDYYKFERVAVKSKLRMDCTASTGSYPEFEALRATKAKAASDKYDETKAGSLNVYYGDIPSTFGADAQRKAGKALTKNRNISSVFVTDPESCQASGDCKGTSDVLLFQFHNLEMIDGRIQPGGIIEVFVARGKSHDRVPLYNLFSNGELDDEIQALREQAKIE